MLHLGCHDLRVQGSASFVNIAPVGTGIHDDDFASKIREELRGNGAGSSISAVDNDSATIERKTRNSGKKEANILPAVGLVNLRRDGLLRGRHQIGKLTKYLFFNS